ncbi:MAG: phosphoribosyl-ATP diphosphatase [Caldilineaceae bacterium]
MSNVIQSLFTTIQARKLNPPSGSYTAKLFADGENEILKKMGEEVVEVIVAAKGQGDDRVIYEMADLVYHSLVLLAARGLEWSQIEEELARRVK